MSSSISVKNKQHIGLVTLLAALFTACSPHALREAQVVIRQADSAWTAGQPYHDSVQLAQAYETLSSFPAQVLATCHPQLATDYAHACYHYGRLLRSHDDPVAAMQCFINASHSRTRDFHILGRVYSNMGSMCELSNEYEMAYDMYSISTRYFLCNGDTLLYFYGLNNMAYESARQGNKDETLSLVDSITRKCSDKNVIAKAWETKAELYNITAPYDSAILCINILQQYGNKEPTGYVIKAQAFDKLGITDSALYYAKYVLSLPAASYHDKYNMLYITAHYDSIDNNEILNQTSQRADIGISIDHQHAKHAQACEILRQYLHQVIYRKPVFILGVIVILSIFVVLGTFLYSTHKKKEIRKKTLQEQKKQKQLIQLQDTLRQKNHLLSKQNALLEEQKDIRYANRFSQIQKDSEWFAQSVDIRNRFFKEDYSALCKLINHHFFMLADKLQTMGGLNEKEICLCVLVLTNSFTDKQLAEMMYYSHKTIRSTKRHVAMKLGTKSANLQPFLLEKALE